MHDSIRTAVVLDNGGGDIKLCNLPLKPSTPTPPTLHRLPNALAKPGKNAHPLPTTSFSPTKRPPGLLVGTEITHAPDITSMTTRRSTERGIITQWDMQRDIWQNAFSTHAISLKSPSASLLVLTEPPANPLRARFAMDELVFDHFAFAAFAPLSAAFLATVAHRLSSAVVLDSGFSATYAVPVFQGRPLHRFVRRLSVGGKVLTNRLKEIVSFNSWNMMEETMVMNAVKERCCYVALDYDAELARARRGEIVKEYLLPDLATASGDKFGKVRNREELDGSEQILQLNNERVAIPEILFNPSDIGLRQAGVAELVFQAVQACPVEMRADLYANVVLTGGNCRFENFQQRFLDELRPLVREEYEVCVVMDDDPVLTPFKGGVRILQEGLPLEVVSKAEFEEGGSHAVLRKLYGDDM